MRRLAFALILVALLTAAWPPHAPVNAQAAEPALQACLQQHRSLSVLFLVDTSLSLKTTDPDAQRVTGLQAAVRGLASLRDAPATIGQSPLDIQIGFLSFGTRTVPSFPDRDGLWQELQDPDATIAQLDAFRTDNESEDTDYVSALEPFADRAANTTGEIGALEALERARPDSCRLLVWFTDGEFDFDYHPPQKKTLEWATPPIVILNRDDTVTAVERGKPILCGEGGLADRLRGEDIANGSGAQVAVVALGSSNFDLVKGIADASGGCGQRPPHGQLYPAGSVPDLILNLRKSVLGPDEGVDAGSTGLPSCAAGPECDDVGDVKSFDYPFQLTGGIGSFNLLTIAGDPSITARLIAPDGETLPLLDDTSTKMRNGVVLKVDQLGAGSGTHQVDATLPPDRPEWIGLWRVRFVTTDASRADELLNRASIYVYAGEVRAKLRDPDQFVRRGRSATFVIELESSGGVVVTRPDFVPVPSLTLTINGTPVAVPDQAPDGTWTISYDVPQSVPGDQLDLTATVSSSIRLADSSQTLPVQSSQPQHLDPIEVRGLPRYPVLDDPVGSFSTVDQHHLVVKSTLEVDASAPESGGCVRLDRAQPPRSDGYPVTPSVTVTVGGKPVDIGKDCAIRLNDGDIRLLDVTVSFDRQNLVERGRAMSAHLEGSLDFTSTSSRDATQTETFVKPYGVATNPIMEVVNPDARTMTVAFLIAAVLPFLIMYGLNLISRKIDVGRAAFVEVPVRYDGGVVSRVGSPSSVLTITDDDVNVVGMPIQGRYRRVNVGGVEFRGHIPRSPFADVSGRAVASGAALVISAKGSTKRGDAGKLEATLSKGEELGWAFRTSAAPERRTPESDETDLLPVDGTLTMLVPRQPDAARRYVASRIHEITERIGDVVRAHAVRPDRLEPRPAPERTTNGSRDAGRVAPRPAPARNDDPFAAPSKANGDASSGFDDPFAASHERRPSERPPEPPVSTSEFDDPFATN
jgi:hypothetical protein